MAQSRSGSFNSGLDSSTRFEQMSPPNLPLALLAVTLTGVATALFVWYLAPVWDQLTSHHLTEQLDQMRRLHIDTSEIPIYMRLWGVALVAGPAVLWVVAEQPLMAVLAAFLIYRAPKAIVRGRIQRQRTALRDQLVSACTNLANTARAGLALPAGFESVGNEAPHPLSAELRRVVFDFKGGRPFADTLRESQHRLNLESYTLLTAALLVCLDRGGKVTEALDRIGHSLQENQRLERKREADTATGRRTVSILALAPFGFLAMFGSFFGEGTKLLFTTLVGQIVLCIVAVLDYVSVIWARSILGLDTAER